MAVVGARTLAVLVGAGYGGSYLYNNMDSARSLAAQILLKHQTAEQSNASAPPNANSATKVDALSAQMDALTREMSRARDQPVVFVGPSGSALKGSLATMSDVFNLLGWAVVAVTVGGVGYYVAVKKNVSLSDLAWVSQSTFNGTVAAMQKGITRVSGAVSAVRRDLGERLRLIEGRVDKVRSSLSDKIEEEVSGVKDGIQELGLEVGDVHGKLDDVHSRIEQLDTKIDTATTGILALVRVVSSLAPDRLQPGTPFYDLKRFADTKHTAEIAGGQPSLRQRLSNGGLRSLIAGSMAPGVNGDSVGDGVEQVEAMNGLNGVKKVNGGLNKVREKDKQPVPWSTN